MRGAAGLLFVKNQRVLMVGTSYKTHWDIPGGVMEEGETPVETAVRECKEEIGVLTVPGRLLCHSILQTGSGLLFAWIFKGDERDVDSFLVDGKEVVAAEWCNASMRSARTTTAPIFNRRLNDALLALQTNTTIYTEIDPGMHSHRSIRPA